MIFIGAERLKKKKSNGKLGSEDSNSKKQKTKTSQAMFLVAGTFSLALVAIGTFLLILPKIPFLLLSAACYLGSSERMHKCLLNNKWFGEYIRNFQEGLGIPLKTKILAMTVL